MHIIILSLVVFMRRIVRVSSSQRGSAETASNFRYTLKSPIMNVVGATLRYANVYNTSYVVNANNRTFIAIASATNYTITLTPGNYTSQTLATELQTKLNAVVPLVFTVTYSTVTNLFTFSAPTAFSFNLVGSAPVARLLGLAAAIVASSGTGPALLVSTRIPVVAKTPLYYLQVAELPSLSDSPNPCFGVIYNPAESNDLLCVTEQVICQELRHPVDLYSVSVRLLDSDFNECDLNGVDYFLEFHFETGC
jgi:hypothetical protein